MTNSERYQRRRLECPCGQFLEAVDEDTLVSLARQHLAEQHPGRTYTAAEILFMAF